MTNAAFGFVALLVGLVVGLGINIISTRLAASKPLFGRLQCTRSKHPLALWQYLPVAGYFAQRGRCSTCGKRVSQMLIVPDAEGLRGVVIRAYIECPECLEQRSKLVAATGAQGVH